MNVVNLSGAICRLVESNCISDTDADEIESVHIFGPGLPVWTASNRSVWHAGDEIRLWPTGLGRCMA